MVVLHDLIHSSSVHQDSFGGAQVSFLLASQSAINSPYSFESGVLHFFVRLSFFNHFSFVVGYHLIILRCYP